jgi:hypothetical protein
MCFATSVSAEDFVPSASKVEAPEIMAADDVNADEIPDGVEAEDVVAVVKGGDKNAYVTADAIVQLSVSEAEKIIKNGEAENADAAQALVDAFNAIAKLEGGVASDKNIAKAAEDLGIANPKMNVTDIFEVNLGEAGNEALKADGASVTLKFKNTSGAVQGKLIVAHMVGDAWKTVAKDKVQVTKDTIKVEFDSLCPVMFISVAEGQAAETDAPGTESNPTDTTPTTPEEKDNNLDTIITVAIIVVVVAGVVVAIYLLYKNGKLDSVVKVNKQRIVHPDRSKYKKSKKAKKWSRKKQTRRQKRRNRK